MFGCLGCCVQEQSAEGVIQWLHDHADVRSSPAAADYLTRQCLQVLVFTPLPQVAAEVFELGITAKQLGNTVTDSCIKPMGHSLLCLQTPGQGVDLSDPAAEEQASSRGQILRELIGTEAPKEMQLAAAAGAVQIFREAHSQKG